MNRADRRRQLIDDRAMLSRGLRVERQDGHEIAALMRVLHDLLGTSIARRSISPLMHFFYTNAAAATARFARQTPVACAKGCAHCCQMWVDASPAEILYLAKSLTGRRRTLASDAVSNALQNSGHMSFDERGTFVSPCPMLEDGACSVYAARPMACRGAASLDAAVCARAYNLLSNEEIPLPVPYMLLGSGYRLALAGAGRRAGLRYQAVELNSGLEVAFAGPGAEGRWLAGDDPFANALAPPIADIFDVQPYYRTLYEAAFSGQ
jgi:hypothetical protein